MVGVVLIADDEHCALSSRVVVVMSCEVVVMKRLVEEKKNVTSDMRLFAVSSGSEFLIGDFSVA